MNKDTDFNGEIERLQNEFYAKQPKNRIFKSAQKLECASVVANSMNLEEMAKRTFFIIPNTNKVFMDYTLFKLYGNPDIYIYLVDYLLYLFNIVVPEYDCFEVHINIEGITVSSCQRHKMGIQQFLNRCLNHDTEYSAKCTKLVLYNIPNVFDTVRQLINPMIHPSVKKKIEYHKKEESAAILNELLN
jgi:CRAL/TRIO domain